MLEQRKHLRFKAHDGIIALSFDDACRLSDISKGGVALACLGKSEIPAKFSLQILMRSQKFHTSVPVKLVWEKEIDSQSFSSIFTKSVGVEFDNLKGKERSEIDFLIDIHQEYGALAV